MMKKIIKFSFILYVITQIIGCGVKGKPQPPLIPPYIGNGIKEVKDDKK